MHCTALTHARTACVGAGVGTVGESVGKGVGLGVLRGKKCIHGKPGSTLQFGLLYLLSCMCVHTYDMREVRQCCKSTLISEASK